MKRATRMSRPALTRLLLAACILVVPGCVPRYGSHHEMTDHEAWDIVRNDPCRYDEYRRFAHDHENPDKRRTEVWRLAHEGCSRERQYDQQYVPGYYDNYR